MSPDNLKEILQGIQAGKISPDEALEKLKTLPFENLGFAHLDHHRQLRTQQSVRDYRTQRQKHD